MSATKELILSIVEDLEKLQRLNQETMDTIIRDYDETMRIIRTHNPLEQ
jgi:hypothetical protein